MSNDTRGTVLRQAAAPAQAPAETRSIVRGAPRPEPRPHQPAGPATARAVGQPDPRQLLRIDAVLAEHVHQMVDDARHAGYAEGLAAGRAEAHARVEQLTAAFAQSATEMRSLTIEHRASFAAEVLDLAEAVAHAVMGRTPHDGGRSLLDRITTEVDRPGAGPMRIALHNDDVGLIAAAVSSDDVEIHVDGQLQPGEAVITTQWSTVELTRAAALDAISTALSTPD